MRTGTGELIQDDYEPHGLAREIRDLRREVEQLKRGGFARESLDDPGRLITSSELAKIGQLPSFTAAHQLLIGSGHGSGTTTALGANEVAGRAGSAAIAGVAVDANEVLAREGSSSLAGVAAAASTILGRGASGDLGFKSAADLALPTATSWPFDDITGSMTLTETKYGGILTHSGDITVTLPTPTADDLMRVYIVSDPHGNMSASDRVAFATAGASDTIDGSTGSTALVNLRWGTFLIVGTASSGVAAWSLVNLT